MKRFSRIVAAILVIVVACSVAACEKKQKNPSGSGGVVDVVPQNTPDYSELSLITASTHTYAVSTSNKLATQVGMKVLENGGNAVDAAVAVAYTLNVVQPYASGLGGGGCLLLFDPATSDYAFYDYFASMRATGTTSRNYIGIPGFAKGMQAVLDDYGTMPLSDLLSYAIDYAENGYTVTDDIEVRINVAYADLKDDYTFYTKDGNLLKEGDTIYMSDFADTLKLIASEGTDVIYAGKIAKHIADSSRTTITMEDLEAYTVAKSNPVVSDFMGYEIAAAPAPFSGVTVTQMLRMAEAIDMRNPNSDAQGYLDDLYKITSHAYTDRYKKIADPSFVKVNEQRLVSAEYISKLLDTDVTGVLDDPEHNSTTHFAIIDENGMVVSSTNTLSSFWGSRVCIDGIYLNDTMKHFMNSDSSINAVKPGKTPRSYSCPMIIRGENGYILAIGTPGGNNIPKILAPVLIDYLKFGVDLQDAIFKGRIFSMSYDTVTVETREFFPLVTDADNSSYYIVRRDDAAYFGNIAAVGYSPEKGRVFSVYDDRRGGTSVSSN